MPKGASKNKEVAVRFQYCDKLFVKNGNAPLINLNIAGNAIRTRKALLRNFTHG